MSSLHLKQINMPCHLTLLANRYITKEQFVWGEVIRNMSQSAKGLKCCGTKQVLGFWFVTLPKRQLDKLVYHKQHINQCISCYLPAYWFRGKLKIILKLNKQRESDQTPGMTVLFNLHCRVSSVQGRKYPHQTAWIKSVYRPAARILPWLMLRTLLCFECMLLKWKNTMN